MALSERAREQIESLLDNNRIVLFMKGNPHAPQCGFSANASGILSSIVDDYATFNVLEDPEMREGIKEYGQWPTIPQLYIDRELIGGSDIISQMFNSGELHEMLGLPKPDRTPPEVTISDRAAESIREGMGGYPGYALHLKVDDYWRAEFNLDQPRPDAIKTTANGIDIYMDVVTAQKARGMIVDWTESLQGEGLTVQLPSAPPAVKPLSVSELKDRIDAGDITLVDVRPESDRVKASIEPVVVLDKEGMAKVNAMPKDTSLAFLCHHGNSSAGYAEHFRKEGFTDVYNVTGGIDAWSKEVDSSVPTY